MSASMKSKKTAIIIPVHPPKFPFLLDFYSGLNGCRTAANEVSYFFVFSSAADKINFWRKAKTKVLSNRPSETDIIIISLVAPEWTQTASSISQFSTIAVAKKFWAMAWLLDQHINAKYIIALDAETALTSCDVWQKSSLFQALQMKYEKHSWIASRKKNCPITMEIIIASAATTTRDSSEIQTLYKKTKDWNLYPWWNDLPWYEVVSLSQMFESWNDERSLSIPEEKSSTFYQNIVEKYNPARNHYSFEHIVYQHYMVLHHDFIFIEKEDINSSCDGSLLEDGFSTTTIHKLDWSPLWMPLQIKKIYKPKDGPEPFFIFHTDRQ